MHLHEKTEACMQNTWGVRHNRLANGVALRPNPCGSLRKVMAKQLTDES